MNITLYTIGCPKCSVLEKKLEQKGIQYLSNSSEDEMQMRGFTSMPMLVVEDDAGETVMDFSTAVKWVNNYNN